MEVAPVPSYPCPICGDPSGYPFWVDKDPPDGCAQPFDSRGRKLDVRVVTDCHYAMGKAAQRAEWRRLVPDAFDENGVMKPDQLVRVLGAWHAAHNGNPPPMYW
jgi:hypothetical protein